MTKAVAAIWRIFLGTLGAWLFLHVAVMAVWTPWNSGMVLTWIVALACLFFAFAWKRLSRFRLFRGLRWAFGAVFVFFAGMTAFLALYGGADTADYREDAVIVLGAGLDGREPGSALAQRLDCCIAYYQKNPDAVIVVTGGQGKNEEIPEALAMKRYLTARGIPEDAVFMETRATNTNENFRYSKELLDRMWKGDSYRVLVISNRFHLFRAMQLARMAGFSQVTHLHAGLDYWNLPVSYIREVCGVLKLWVLRQ